MENLYIPLIFLIIFIIIAALVSIHFKLRKLRKINLVEDLQSEVNELILELNQTTDRNLNILEDKILGLTRLLNDADKRIRILKTESDRGRGESLVYNQLGRIKDQQQVPDLKVNTPAAEVTKKERIIELHNNGFTTSVIASRVGATVGEVELIISMIEGR